MKRTGFYMITASVIKGLNILNNYITHETIVCNDRDPIWFNGKIRILKKKQHTSIFVKNDKMVTMLIGNIV